MKINDATRILGALAQPSRLEVFRLLVRRGTPGACAGEIARELDIAPATLSFHLTALRHAGLVKRQVQGRERRYFADFATMHALVDYLTENCCQGADCRPTAASDIHAG